MKTGQIKKSLRTRAQIYRCAITDRDQIRELARSETPVETLEKLLGF
jgi:hypothetical protein